MILPIDKTNPISVPDLKKKKVLTLAAHILTGEKKDSLSCESLEIKTSGWAQWKIY